MRLAELVNEVKPFLREYLKSQNIPITPAGGLDCIAPDHGDTTQSAQLNTKGDSSYLYCHSCHSIFDIFSAASVLENLPANGMEWIEDNVFELAERFDIQFSRADVIATVGDPRVFTARRAYNVAAQTLANGALSLNSKTYCSDKGWSNKTIEAFGLGSIGADRLVASLVASGFDSQFLNEIGLVDYSLFREDGLVFPIHDFKGGCVGFTARLFKGTSKYHNSTSFNSFSPYKKTEHLFNLHRILKTTGPVYLVEGQGDVASLWNAGIRAVAICGSTISFEQINLLKTHITTPIHVWMDNDEPGRMALYESIIPALLKNQMFPLPKVVSFGILDGGDPADYIKTHTEPPLSTNIIRAYYEWLTSQDPEADRATLAERILALVANYKLPTVRAVIVDEIAELTGINALAIKERLEQLDSDEESQRNEQRDLIVKTTIKQLERSPGDATRILVSAQAAIENVSHRKDSIGVQSWIDCIRSLKEEEENKGVEFPGLFIPGFPKIEFAFGGEWSEKMMIIGGDENTGKSTIAAAMLYAIAADSRNDAMVILHVVDDSAKETLPKLLCMADREIGDGTLAYLNITNPKYSYTATRVQDIEKKRERAYTRVQELAADSRIIIKDVRDGNDMSFSEATLRYYRSKFPNRHIIYWVDSLNKVGVPPIYTDERSMMTYRADNLKRFAVTYGVTTGGVCEFNRPQDKTVGKYIVWPNNKRFAEARALEYDANACILLYNDLHARGTQNATIFWKDNLDKQRPRICAIISKNKISDEKGSIYYDLYQDRAKFTEISDEIVQREAREAEASLADKANGGDYGSWSPNKDYEEQEPAYIERGTQAVEELEEELEEVSSKSSSKELEFGVKDFETRNRSIVHDTKRIPGKRGHRIISSIEI